MTPIKPGYILRSHDALADTLNNWRDAEVLRVDGDTLSAMPMRPLNERGQPLQAFDAKVADIMRHVEAGKMEIVPVVEANKNSDTGPSLA